MSTIADDDLRVIAGVDTHKDFHVVVVLDELGRKLDTETFPTTSRGYRDLTGWVTGFGEVLALGVEGTGSWGAGLCRHLRARGLNVIEVNQPDRHRRRRRGKSDRIDAEMAARTVLAGDATALPKAGDGPVEALRQLRLARSGAMKARTAAANQLHSVCDTAPEPIRAQLRGLTTRRKVHLAARFRPGDPLTPTGGAKRALVAIARRWLTLDAEIRDLNHAIKQVLDAIATPLLEHHGVGYETAGRVVVHRGRQPPTTRHRVELRRAVRHRTRARVDRELAATTTQPRRRSTRQLRALDDRHGPTPKPTRTNRRLPRTTRQRRTLQTRRNPLPQTVRRTRALQRHPSHHPRQHHPTTTRDRRLTPRGASVMAWTYVR